MDLEKRIKSEFENMRVSAPAPCHARVTPKRYFKKGFVVLAMLMVLMVGGAAVAAATGLFGLRQLGEIVGEDNAVGLEALGFAGYDGGFDTGFVTDCGLQIGLIAARVQGSIADFYIMMKDSQGRLDGDFHLDVVAIAIPQNPLEMVGGGSSSRDPMEIIERNAETGVIVLQSTHRFNKPLDNVYLHLSIFGIHYGEGRLIDLEWETRYEASGEEPLGLGLQARVEITGDSFIEISGLEIRRVTPQEMDDTIYRIVITPVSVILNGHFVYYRPLSDDLPRFLGCGWREPITYYCCMMVFIHMYDGSRINVIPQSASGTPARYTGGILSWNAHMQPLVDGAMDLSGIAAVEILGEIIEISNSD